MTGLCQLQVGSCWPPAPVGEVKLGLAYTQASVRRASTNGPHGPWAVPKCLNSSPRELGLQHGAAHRGTNRARFPGPPAPHPVIRDLIRLIPLKEVSWDQPADSLCSQHLCPAHCPPPFISSPMAWLGSWPEKDLGRWPPASMDNLLGLSVPLWKNYFDTSSPGA